MNAFWKKQIEDPTKWQTPADYVAEQAKIERDLEALRSMKKDEHGQITQLVELQVTRRTSRLERERDEWKTKALAVDDLLREVTLLRSELHAHRMRQSD